MRRLAVGLLAVLLLAGCTGSGGGTSTGGSGSATGSSSGPSGGGSSTPPSDTTSPSTPAGTSSSAPASGGGARTAAGPKLTAFRVVDVSYVGNAAWALGTAQCLSGGGRCGAMEHSTDGGRTWSSLPTPAGTSVRGVGTASCSRLCLQAVRFATTKVGYVYGSSPAAGSARSVLYLTTDGGHSWRSLQGGAQALESLDGNVIRVVSTTAGCPPGCEYRVQTSGIGSMSWRAATLPGRPVEGDGALLARTGHYAYLLVVGHPAGGGSTAHSTLYTSSTDGTRWTARGEPCPQSGRTEVDAGALTSAPDGSVTVLCRERGGRSRSFTATSTRHGASFTAGSRSALGGADIATVAAASSRVLLISSDETYRSTDGGRHFARLSANAGSSPGSLSWLGFASASVAHGISTDGRSIWTGTDGGRSWTRHRFS